MRGKLHWPVLVLAATIVPSCCLALQAGGDAASRAATLELAAKLIGAHDLSGAETALQKLLSQSKDDPLALNLLGFIRMQQQEPVRAEELFRRAAKLGPHLAGPHVNLALLFGAARAEDAIVELSEALKLSPGHEQARLLLREIATKAAAGYVRSGDPDRALALMLRAREAAPDDPDLLVDTALAAMEKGLYADGVKFTLDALRIRPDFPRATYALARAYMGDSKLPLAEEQMRKYLAMKPDDASAQYGLGLMLVAEQKVDEARPAFEKSLALDPQQTESLFQLGEISVQEGKREQAAEEYGKVLTRDPRHAGALTGLGMLAFRDGKLDDAESKLAQAVALAPSYYKAHYYYSLTLKKLGKAEEAEREFKISTDLQKRDKPTARLAPDRP